MTTTQAEMPALAFALLATGALLSARGGWRKAWFAAAGFCFALGVLCKLLVAPMFIPLLFLLILAPPSGPEKWKLPAVSSMFFSELTSRLLLFGLGGIAACLIALLPWDIAAVYDQAVRFHLEMKRYFHSDWSRNLNLLYQLLQIEIGVTLLAVAGLIMLLRKNALAAAWLCLWIAATALFLIDHAPLYLHHAVLFLPPLAVAAAASVLWLPLVWRKPWGRLFVLAFFLPLLAYVPSSRNADWSTWKLGLSLRRNWQVLSEAAPNRAEEQEVIALIQQHTGLADYVVSDQQMQVFRAGRQMPPRLCDTSIARVRSGYLTDEEAIAASRDARMIIFWTNRLAQLPRYRQWARSNYQLLRRFDGPQGRPKEIYLRH